VSPHDTLFCIGVLETTTSENVINTMSLLLLFYLTTGAIAGMLAGLFGIGGGLVLVPILLFALANQVSSDALMPLALGTSLAAVVFSSASSAWGHHRKGAVDLSLVRKALPALTLGAVIGAIGAAWAPRQLLVGFLALFQSLLCVYMIRKTFWPAAASTPIVRDPSRAVLGSVGLTCALSGIGGGTMAVPYFRYLGVAPLNAIGTASALGVPISFAAASGFLVAGLVQGTTLPNSIGYVNWMALSTMVPGVLLGAQLGAHIAHALPAKLLMGLFCAFMALSASKAIGSLFL
jgi:uncharacterized membrane protein YfcA